MGRHGLMLALGGLLILSLVLPQRGTAGTPAAPQAVALQSVLAAGRPPLPVPQSQAWAQLAAFYRQRSYRPAWLEQGQPGVLAGELLEVLRNAGAEGLCAEDYYLDAIEGLLAAPPPPSGLEALARPERARLDLLLSAAFLRYVVDLGEGRIDPNRALADWQARPRRVEPLRLLRQALQTRQLRALLDGLRPPYPGYFALRQALADYRRRWLAGGYPFLPPGPELQPGAVDPRVQLLRRRLQASGDLEAAASGPTYDAATVAALRRFQQRHGLAADGVLGPDSREALNIPITRRIEQLELNLERWRWLPPTLGERYLLVNVADYTLTLVDAGQPQLTLPVIVGTVERPTPVFSGRVSYLELAPYWYVPQQILEEDLLPKLQADPELLVARHFEVVADDGETAIDPASIDWQQVDAEHPPGRVRQEPGPWNPLGRIKFMFPNAFAVYLHDTSEPGLFARRVRTFSSGCIRIEHPFELARLLLGKEADSILGPPGAEILPTAPQRVDLTAAVPIHILYWTAWVDAAGRVNFRDDIYSRDLSLEVALAPSAPYAGQVIARHLPAAHGRGI